MGIRTSTNLLFLAAAAGLLAGCAKGAEISPEDVFILQPRPAAGADAGADAAAPTGFAGAVDVQSAAFDEAEADLADELPAAELDD